MSITLPDLAQATAQEVLAYGIENFHPRLTLACSFQKEESVLFHMLSEIEPGFHAFVIDTGVLFPETLTTWKQFEQRFPDAQIDDRWSRPSSTATSSGIASRMQLLRRSAKVEPMRRAGAFIRRLRGSPASGASRIPAPEPGRPKFELGQEAAASWKLNPIADWSEKRRLELHPSEHRLPVQPAPRSRGIDSIGCTHVHAAGGSWRRPARRPLGRAVAKTECGIN